MTSDFPRRVGILALLALLAGCRSSASDSETQPEEIASVVRQATIPQEHQAGEAAFNANCAACHGERGLGTDRGPPLIHIIYEPSHHADISFIVAADRGVRAHHWQFGDMPPLPDIPHDQVLAIIAYIRYLQEQVGIV
jgi:mono/diheme cytochrome c family protein